MKNVIINVLWFLLGITVVALVTGIVYITPIVYKLSTLCDRNPALFRNCK